MTDNTDRKKLIREASDAMYDVYSSCPPFGGLDIEGMARAALAVFEKAHTATDDFPHGRPELDTPTDGEREALASVIDNATMFPSDDIERSVDAILAAGFRRTEVPEPSTEDWDNRDDEVNGETRGFLSCGRCSWSMSRGLFADLHEHERTHESEPQGEPSDAQVLAALNARAPAGRATHEATPRAGALHRPCAAR